MELSLDTYKQPQVMTYRTPSSRRFFTNKAKRLIRLATRIYEGRLFLPDIVAMLREAADELIELGNLLLLTDKGSEALHGLTWIKSRQLAPDDMEWDIREKARHHVRREDRVRCALCKTPLVWPAQIVWRRGLTVVQTSADIGIYCLTREAIRHGWGKLQDLITEVRAVRAQHAPPGTPGTQNGTSDSPAPTPSREMPPPASPPYHPVVATRPAPMFLQLSLIYPDTDTP